MQMFVSNRGAAIVGRGAWPARNSAYSIVYTAHSSQIKMSLTMMSRPMRRRR